MALLNNNLNYFSYSPETKDLLATLRTKANYLTRYPSGMSPAEKNATMNQMVEKIRAGEAPEVESMQVRMARQGILGSGIEEAERGKIGRNYDAAVAGAKRDVTIADQSRRAAETIAGTNASAGLAGMLMGGETNEEDGQRGKESRGVSVDQHPPSAPSAPLRPASPGHRSLRPGRHDAIWRRRRRGRLERPGIPTLPSRQINGGDHATRP